MSNALSIAAVTQTLVNLLSNGIGADPQQLLPQGIRITAQPPDAANGDQNVLHQVNLFLYHITPNAAWNNMPVPPSQNGIPPLALNLYYMVTAYSRDGGDSGDINSHNLLGRVMRVFHDHPVLSSGDITMTQSDVQNQIDRIRITLQPLTIEEIFRLWSGFLTQYRMSVSYEVSVVLIESSRVTSVPLPVLKVGRDGRGAVVTPDPYPYPTLFSARVDNVVLPAPPGIVGGFDISSIPPAPLPGDVLVLNGHRLNGLQVSVEFTSAQGVTSQGAIVAGSNTGSQLKVTVPPTLPAGIYTVVVVIKQGGVPDQRTNALAVSVVPQIDTSQPITSARDAQDIVTITLSSVQPVLVGQRVSLLLNDLEIQAQPIDPAHPKNLTFLSDPKQLPAGVYLLRMRVDGVDSFPFVRNKDFPQQPFDPFKNPPDFDPNQRINVK